MTNEKAPTWKYWHPLPLWKVLAIFALFETVGVVGGVLLFPVLGLSGDIGLMVGAGVTGTIAYVFVLRLAHKAKAATAAASDGG